MVNLHVRSNLIHTERLDPLAHTFSVHLEPKVLAENHMQFYGKHTSTQWASENARGAENASTGSII